MSLSKEQYPQPLSTRKFNEKRSVGYYEGRHTLIFIGALLGSQAFPVLVDGSLGIAFEAGLGILLGMAGGMLVYFLYQALSQDRLICNTVSSVLQIRLRLFGQVNRSFASLTQWIFLLVARLRARPAQ